MIAIIIPSYAQTSRYLVQSGDSVWTISQKFGVPVQTIIDLNNINNAEQLYTGQELILRETAPSGDKNNGNYLSYTVKQGDSLWIIASNFGVTIEDIIGANNNLDINSHIYTGQTIKIPLTEKADETEEKENNHNYIYYEIQAGDILWNISREFNTTVEQLVEINSIRDAYDLYPGRILIIPAGKDESDESRDDKEKDTEEPVGEYTPYFFYNVRQDDHIWTIADNFGLRVSELINYNNISDINNIKEGELLIIPLNKSSKYRYIRDASIKLSNYYRVQSGETLSEIVNYFEIPEEGIRALNNMTKNEEIYTGQRLLMPVSPAFFTEHELYQVKTGGEYLFDIAYNKGVSIRSILKANYLSNPNKKFEEGTTIIVALDEDSQTTWIDFKDGKPQNSLFFN